MPISTSKIFILKYEKIKITSSSFLVPNNKAWLNLEEIYKIDFSDYGNWIKTLFGIQA